MRPDDGESGGERAEAPPHGIALFEHAEISAEIARAIAPSPRS